MKINKSLILLFLAAFSIGTYAAEPLEQPTTVDTPLQRAKNHPYKTIIGGLCTYQGIGGVKTSWDLYCAKTENQIKKVIKKYNPFVDVKKLSSEGLAWMRRSNMYWAGGIGIGATLIGCYLLYDVFLKKEPVKASKQTTINQGIKNDEK